MDCVSCENQEADFNSNQNQTEAERDSDMSKNAARKRSVRSNQSDAEKDVEKKIFPPCNLEWSKEKGTR